MIIEAAVHAGEQYHGTYTGTGGAHSCQNHQSVPHYPLTVAGGSYCFQHLQQGVLHLPFQCDWYLVLAMLQLALDDLCRSCAA